MSWLFIFTHSPATEQKKISLWGLFFEGRQHITITFCGEYFERWWGSVRTSVWLIVKEAGGIVVFLFLFLSVCLRVSLPHTHLHTQIIPLSPKLHARKQRGTFFHVSAACLVQWSRLSICRDLDSVHFPFLPSPLPSNWPHASYVGRRSSGLERTCLPYASSGFFLFFSFLHPRSFSYLLSSLPAFFQFSYGTL